MGLLDSSSDCCEKNERDEALTETIRQRGTTLAGLLTDLHLRSSLPLKYCCNREQETDARER